MVRDDVVEPHVRRATALAPSADRASQRDQQDDDQPIYIRTILRFHRSFLSVDQVADIAQDCIFVYSISVCQAEITVKRLTPALVNDHSISEKVQETSRRVLPDFELRTAGYLTMGAEDAAFLLEKVDGCFFFVGSANKERHLDYGHHHPKFDFDEEALIHGTALMAAAAMDILNAT